jgi:acyl-CoA synthetase (AMP-forming)/AMP-acid ligase II
LPVAAGRSPTDADTTSASIATESPHGSADHRVAEVGPVPWETIPAMLRDVATRHARRDAVVDGDGRFDFVSLIAESGRVARALHAAGIRPGDRVAIWASNSWRWVVSACGIWQLGAVVVPLASRWKARGRSLIRRTEARLMFVRRERR